MVVTSEKLFQPPLDPRYVVVLAVCGCCACISGISGFRLFTKHLRAGQERSGFITPDVAAQEGMAFALSIPTFALFSLLAVILVELAPVWRLIEIMVLASNFAKIPGMFKGRAEGTLTLQRTIKERSQQGSLQRIQLYGHPPCCCLKIFSGRATMPKNTDLVKLTVGIYQLCIIAPTVAFIELVVVEERIMGGTILLEIYSNLCGSTFCKFIRVASQLSCMSSCKGLVELVSYLSGQPEAKSRLTKKLSYCQSYLFVLNLLPTLLQWFIEWAWGRTRLVNEESLSRFEMSNFVTSTAICVGTLYVSLKAWQAFPVSLIGNATLNEQFISADA